MIHDRFETKLERFVINHYDAIGRVNFAVFLAGLVISLLVGSSVNLGVFTALMLGFTIASMVLVGSPARKRMRAWHNNKAQWKESQQLNQVFVLADK